MTCSWYAQRQLGFRPATRGFSLGVLLWSLSVIACAAQDADAPPDLVDTTWRYTIEDPGDGWTDPEYDATSWREGKGGFGRPGTPGSFVQTRWLTVDIWLRRSFQLDEIPERPALLIHHDESAEVYLNGRRVAQLTGFVTRYRLVPLDAAGQAALRQGENLVAVYCHQTLGGQYIDCHVVDADRVPAGFDVRPLPTLKTRWAREALPDHAWPDYPRPQMRRARWSNLNGPWQYAITPREADRPESWDGHIVVPFCAESQLSGVQREVRPDQALWYRRTFPSPEELSGRQLLHFGAVDWEAHVWLNGRLVARHQGGFDGFSVDMTGRLRPDAENELVVRAWDPTDTGPQPCGKQRLEARGIFYTPVTGIWQTVWAERVPATYVQRVRATPDIDAGEVDVRLEIGGDDAQDARAEVQILDENFGLVARAEGPADEVFTLAIPDARLWHPEDPHLYDVRVVLSSPSTEEKDLVFSYVGMRKISIMQDESGIERLALNNQILFHCGPLDQGWWPDGLYTSPNDAALRYDVEVTQLLGFNATRKHVKIEPQRWYYWCDRLGLMVWQDMPSTRATFTRVGDEDGELDEAAAAIYRRELERMIDQLSVHPSVVIWVPFNEGWGQHHTSETIQFVRRTDPTRLVGGPSGWMDFGQGDLIDIHRYPGPGMHPPVDGRASVLSEFGGIAWIPEGHLWDPDHNWGYRVSESREALQEAYDRLMGDVDLLKRAGLAAAIYTQLTDVETEVNGLLTYDRELIKVDVERLYAHHQLLYQDAPSLEAEVLLPTSRSSRREWRFSTTDPGDGWAEPDFDDAGWQTGDAPFGNPDTPAWDVETAWTADELWLRQEFTVSAEKLARVQQLFAEMQNNDRAVVYLNGREILTAGGHSPTYRYDPLPLGTRRYLREGRNVIAVHVTNQGRAHFFDFGLSDMVSRD